MLPPPSVLSSALCRPQHSRPGWPRAALWPSAYLLHAALVYVVPPHNKFTNLLPATPLMISSSPPSFAAVRVDSYFKD